MARAIWTKLRNDPNGTWSRHEGEPPFSIPVVGGMYYDVYTDTGDSFVIMPQFAAEAPKLSGAPVVEGTYEVGQTLTAIAAPATGTPPIATAWQWLRDGVEIIGATDVTYTLKNADEGKAITVRQSDSNAHGSDSATSEAVTVAPVTPVVTAPVISGLPTIAGIAEVDQTLTAIAAPVTGTAPIDTTWQWLRDGTEIAGATDVTYTLKNADEGKAITVRQSDSNAHGSDSATSEAVTVAPVTPVVTAPVISGLPTIAGIAEVDQTLTAIAATVTGTAPIDTTWQWLRDGTEIAGATDATYTLTVADEEKAIAVRQTDTNAQGSDSAASETVTVAPVTPVATAPVISGLPTIAGIAEVGQTLTATAAPVTGTAPIDTTWQWWRDAEPVSGEQNETYVLTAIDENTDISVRQRSTNAYGTDKATSAAVTVRAPTVSGKATITGLFVSDQTSTGEVTLTYSITADSGVAGVLTRSATTPSATQILAGQDHSGASAASIFSDTWTTTGSDTLPDITAGLPTDIYYLHVLPVGGDNADAVTSNGFTMETSSPVVLSAKTTESGDQIDIRFSEILVGSSSATDWTLTADGTPLPVGTVSLAKDTVTLTLSSLAKNGQKLSLSYAGTTLEDEVSNPVALFSNRAVTNAVVAGFSENAVTVPAGAYLTAPDPLPTDSRSLLFFASLTQKAGYDARVALATWDGVNGGFHTQYVGGTGTCGIRLCLQGGTAKINQTNADVPIGTRYHTLVSAWIANDQMHAIAYILNTATGNWTEAVNTAEPAGANAALNLTANNLRLFARSDRGNQPFAGTINRVAMWSGSVSAPMADITQDSVRQMFATSQGLADPALSRVTVGQPLLDFHGKATDYNTGSHSGSLRAFAPTGTFG